MLLNGADGIRPHELPVSLHLRNLSPVSTASYELLLQRDEPAAVEATKCVLEPLTVR